MFATNIPPDVRKGDLWRLFGRFGEVVDVYIASKKDVNKKIFAFIRFKNVRSDHMLEANLQGINIGGQALAVNIANMEHLVSLNPELALGDDEAFTMKYIGGLRVGLQFRSLADVSNFSSIFGEWFSEFGKDGSILERFDRVAWVKVESWSSLNWNSSYSPPSSFDYDEDDDDDGISDTMMGEDEVANYEVNGEFDSVSGTDEEDELEEGEIRKSNDVVEESTFGSDSAVSVSQPAGDPLPVPEFAEEGNGFENVDHGNSPHVHRGEQPVFVFNATSPTDKVSNPHGGEMSDDVAPSKKLGCFGSFDALIRNKCFGPFNSGDVNRGPISKNPALQLVDGAGRNFVGTFTSEGGHVFTVMTLVLPVPPLRQSPPVIAPLSFQSRFLPDPPLALPHPSLRLAHSTSTSTPRLLLVCVQV
ncbi:hypothetical protein L1887_36466 [Cichorium endivia]|nr:hypothetical protein L1887_36466 [Cichorium endivia]